MLYCTDNAARLFSRSFCLWLSELQTSCLYMPLFFPFGTGWFLWLSSVTRGKLLRCVIPMFHVSRLHNRREARFWWSYCPLLLTFVCGWTTGAAPCSSWLVRKLTYQRYQHTHTLIRIYENTVFRIYIMSPRVEPPEYDRRIRGVVSKSPRDSIVVGL